MNNKEMFTELENDNRGKAQELCAKIRQDAEIEIKSILTKGKKEADSILSEGRAAAEKKGQELLKELEKEIEKIKEKIFSTLTMEKKRIILEERNIFFKKVLESVKKKAEGLRTSKEYEDLLATSVLEGVMVVDFPDIEVQYSAADAKVVTDSFAEKMEKKCAEKLGRKQVLRFQRAAFGDIGVIVRTADGRLTYDNRFLSRLSREYDEIYMELLRGAL